MRVLKTGAPAIAALFCILAAPIAACAQGDSAIASVNGDSIPMAEFFDRVQHLGARDFIVSASPLTVRAQNAGQLALDRMINERLTLQWASKTNLMPPDAEIDAEVGRMKQQPQVRQALSTHQLTEEALKQSLRFQRAMYNLATTGVTVSPLEAEKYYKDHLAAYTVPERWTLEGFTTTKQADVSKIEADLKAGKPYIDVLKAYCDDPAIVGRNGTMGTFAATDPTTPAPIREAAAALKDGQVSLGLKIEGAAQAGKPKTTIWWFIRMVHKEPAATQPYPVVKPQVEQSALLEKAGGMQVADKKIADYRQLSEIRINLPGYDMLLPKVKK